MPLPDRSAPCCCASTDTSPPPPPPGCSGGGGIDLAAPIAAAGEAGTSGMASPAQKRLISSAVPVFVPSLSWQSDRFYCKTAQEKAFFAPSASSGSGESFSSRMRMPPTTTDDPKGHITSPTPVSFSYLLRFQRSKVSALRMGRPPSSDLGGMAIHGLDGAGTPGSRSSR